MSIGFVDAARLAQTNRTRWEELQARHAALVTQVEGEAAGFDARRRATYRLALEPLRDVLARLKHIDLADLVDTEPEDVAGVPEVEMPRVRLAPLGWLGSLAGGLVTGVGVGAASVAGVGAFAAASTGTPIATLSGAAATNATLAWLGGGTIAAGGGGIAAGTTVLGGIVVAPAAVAAVGFGSVKGRRERAAQRRTSGDLDAAEAAFAAEEARWTPIVAGYRELRSVLADLQDAIADRVPALGALVEANDDYSSFESGQRRWLAELVGLATVAAEVMASPPDAPDRTVTKARRRLSDLNGKGPAT